IALKIYGFEMDVPAVPADSRVHRKALLIRVRAEVDQPVVKLFELLPQPLRPSGKVGSDLVGMKLSANRLLRRSAVVTIHPALPAFLVTADVEAVSSVLQAEPHQRLRLVKLPCHNRADRRAV